jgi:nicotinate-nucleotide adenylyltransferase
MSELRAYFGGTFDPVHWGHLRSAEQLARQIGLQQIVLLPNNVPPHRPQPEASAEQRLAMLKAAIENNPLFTIDDRELQRASPSWTVTSLEMIRAEQGPQQPLAFIIGQDALLTINQWHSWQELLELSHLIVCQRPGYASQHPDPRIEAWISQHSVDNSAALNQTAKGCIFHANTELISISATDIRRRHYQQQDCHDLLPQPVIDYIEKTGLYRDRTRHDILNNE